MEHIDAVNEEPGQRIAVTAVKDSRVQVAFQQKEAGIWKTRRDCTGWAGRNGYGKREEGDGRTPVGRLSFLYAFGTCPSPGTQFPYRRMDAIVFIVNQNRKTYRA